MEQKRMTALISAFARAYHATTNRVKIFNDSLAKRLLSEDEFNQTAQQMSSGIGFFCPGFKGTSDQALRFIVDNQLASSPLGRAAFAEQVLKTAVQIGAKQYLILGSGYDTFAYRQPGWASDLQIFEVDHPLTQEDKKLRIATAGIQVPANVSYIAADFRDINWKNRILENAQFDGAKISFCSLLGISYYLSKQNFQNMLYSIACLVPEGSSIVFDYPDELSYTELAGERAQRQAAMAKAASEEMLFSYDYKELEMLLQESGWLIYEHLTPDEITAQYFEEYNVQNPGHEITAFDNVNYCLAVKK